MKVALVYDRVNKWGGAERVLLALHKIFPDAPLYTSVYNKKTAPWAKVFKIKTSFLQNFPFASQNHEFYAPLMPLAFESFSFDEYDLIISVTSEAAKGIITKPGTLHICYCLTPTRYLWSGYDEYFKKRDSAIFSPPLTLSAEIAPPLRGSPRQNGQWLMVNDKYFLIVSRLVPYKRIDLAVKVFNKQGLPLKIIG